MIVSNHLLLYNHDGSKKPKILSISRKAYRDLLNQTYQGIIKKLECARALLDVDEYIAAGLYTYALEELGKILLLKQSERTDTEIRIEYCSKFTNHKTKFRLSFDYLQQYRHGQCIILDTSRGFSPNSFSWRGFSLGLLADFESRLSIFYSDLTNNDGIAQVKEIPPVDRQILRKAIDELKVVMLNEAKLDDVPINHKIEK